MNSTLLKKSLSGGFLLLALSLSACAKKDATSGVRIAGRGLTTGCPISRYGATQFLQSEPPERQRRAV